MIANTEILDLKVVLRGKNPRDKTTFKSKFQRVRFSRKRSSSNDELCSILRLLHCWYKKVSVCKLSSLVNAANISNSQFFPFAKALKLNGNL